MGAQQRGWQVTGVEPVAASAAYARDARNLNVKGALLEEAGLPEASFDVVCAMHVLEHLPRVTDFLMTIARWVKPGGHLFVEVPNYRSVQRRNSGAAWVGLRPLEHVAHFTPATLSATLRRAGLEPVVVRTPTYLWPEQGLSFALNDLGQLRWLRWLEPLSVDTGETEASSQRVKVPIAPVRVLLRAVQSAYDLGKVGMLVVAVARRP
jgi:SAM-dependent methyltransferase